MVRLDSLLHQEEGLLSKNYKSQLQVDLNQLVTELMKDHPSSHQVQACAERLSIPYSKDSISMNGEEQI
jgi:hypothetical protein